MLIALHEGYTNEGIMGPHLLLEKITILEIKMHKFNYIGF
jgi:hypothetical protein